MTREQVVCVSPLSARLCAGGRAVCWWSLSISVRGNDQRTVVCHCLSVGEDVQANPLGARGGAGVDEPGACGNKSGHESKRSTRQARHVQRTIS